MKHLLTFLRHDVSGTLASTVGSPSAHRRGTMLKHYAFMLLFLLGSLNVWGYTITFSTGSGDGTSASTSTACSTIVSDGASYLSGNLVTATRVYYSGDYGLKLGASSNAGTIKMNLASSVTPTSIVVRAKLYNSSKATTLKVNGSATQNITTDFSNLTFNITSSTSYIQLESSKYCWIESITVNTGSSEPTVSVTPENITWEGIAANAEKSEEITVTLSNIEAVMAELSGDNPTAFSINKNYLEASGKIIVSKNTTTIGNYAATLTISDADTQTKTIALSMEVVADPEPTGTFEKFTGTIEEGDYVLVANGTTDALKNTITSDRFDCGTVEVADNKIVNPDKSVIWHIAANDAYWTMYNESTTSYAGGTTSKNQGALLDAVTDLAKWTITVDDKGVYTFENYGRSQQKSDANNKFLSKNGQNAYWATYASGQKNPVLYKKHVDVAVEKPTISGETSFLTSTTVTLDCSTDGATIYYTTDESDPKTSETKQIYSDAFNLTETTKVRAIANKGDDWSEEATSKTFTKITPDYTTIAAFLSEKPNEDKYIQFAGNVVVTGVNGKNVFIQDESGNAICLYFATAPSPAWTKGHKVTGMFQAKYASYGNMPEMSIASGKEGTIAATETAALPDPIEITSLAEATINANMCKYVVLKGVYFQGQSLTNKVVNLQDASSNFLKFYDNLSLTDGKALPLTATACDVTGVLISYHQNSPSADINEILPVDVACINAGTATLPTLSTAGSTDEEHPTMVANGESITITPAAGFTSTLNAASLNAATNISITETESNTVIAVSASRDYYATANATYYFKANPAGTKYAITVVQPAQGGSLEANFAETEAGNIVTLTATPTNSHFTFDGWVVKKTGEPEASPETVTENQFSMPEYDVTVTGSFTEEGKATLTFAKGEATGTEDAPANIENYAGEVTLPACPFTYTGHYFIGWKKGETEDIYQPGAYTITAADVTAGTIAFTAQWAEISVWATTYSSNVTVGTDKVVINTVEYAAKKTGTSNAFGSTTIEVPTGATTLHFHAAGWGADAVVNLEVKKGETLLNTFALTTDAGVKSNSPFTLKGTPYLQYYSVALSEITEPTTITFEAKNDGGKRFVLYGVNQEGGTVPVTITANPMSVSFGSVEQNASVTAKTINVTLQNVAAATATLGGTNPEAFTIDKTALVDGDVITVSVASTATAGDYTATITITDNAGVATEKVVNVSLTVTEPEVNDDVTGTWTLVTDAANLVAGKKVIIAQYVDADGAVNTMAGQASNNRSVVESSVDGATLTPATGTKVMTLADAGTDKFYLQTSNGKYLYNASTSSKSYLRTKDESKDASWTISVTAEGVATITSVENTNRSIMRYNPNTSGSPLFNCYASGQNAVALYMLEETTPPTPVLTEVRTGLTAGNYYTMCLEKAVTDVRGGSIWRVLSKAQNTLDIILEEVDGTLDAGRPYIFFATADKLEVVYEGAAVGAPITTGNNGLVGSFEKKLIAQAATNYIIYNNALYFVNSDNVYVGAHRAYLDMTGVPPYSNEPQQGNAPRRRVTMAVHGEQVATGMENVQGDNVQCTKVLINGQLFIIRGEKMYDATGRLVK